MVFKDMKVLQINHLYRQQKYYNKSGHTECSQRKNPNEVSLPQGFYYPTNISFGLENAKNLKKLFSYGLPCMYTGVEMIDPQIVQQFISQGLHKLPSSRVCDFMDTFYDSMLSNEKEVYEIIREQANIEPRKNLQEILKSLKLQYEDELIKKQLPIFKTLNAYAFALPAQTQEQVNKLLKEAEDKIHQRPVSSEFSVTEFKYKLSKIKEDIAKLHDKKSLGTVNKFIRLSEDFEPQTDSKNIYSQRKIVSDMEKILHNSSLYENAALNSLINNAKAQLNNEKILIPFSRKTFLYDLNQIIKDIEDTELKASMMKIAEKLPTSKSSNAAYITKFSKEPPEKIFYRLLWPSLATVEHILPRSCHGKNEMSNYGGACARENSDRHNLPFMEQLRRRPQTAENCQKYIDRLIQYANEGVFKNENIDISYIEDFKNTIAEQSQGTIILDTSKLNPKGRLSTAKPASKQKKLQSN